MADTVSPRGGQKRIQHLLLACTLSKKLSRLNARATELKKYIFMID